MSPLKLSCSDQQAGSKPTAYITQAVLKLVQGLDLS